MKLFRGIIGIVISLYIRIWIINNSFKGGKNKLKINLYIFLISAILVAILYFYKDILSKLGLEKFYLENNINIGSIFSFIFYCCCFLILLTTSLGNIKKENTKKFIITALLLFVGIGIGGFIVGINTILIYYIISCYAEEILKFSAGQNVLYKKGSSNKTNLILFAIMTGLGFSVAENIFYLIVANFSGGQSIISGIGRNIFTTLLHIVATGLIAFFVVKKDNKKLPYIIKCSIGILCGFGLHALYNLSLQYGNTLSTIIILIICYFILSFLLFKSDIIYKKEN